MPTPATPEEVFDYVIVGAGTAGCVLAERLSADGRASVCVLEAGPPDRHIHLHVPGGFFKAIGNPRFATLGWLGSVHGHRTRALGVEHFGQSGSIAEVYAKYGIDTDAILRAAWANIGLKPRAVRG